MNKVPPEEFYASLPRKRSAALVAYPCPGNTILLLDPTYRTEWLLPGGAIEEDESPLSAAKRESIEEIGFEKVTNTLLVLNYIKTHGYKSETYHLVFRGEDLTEDDLQSISLNDVEHKGFKCVTLEEAQKLGTYALSQMFPFLFEALETGKTVYMEGTTRLDA